MINIGNTLKEHRLASSYTQSALAKATNIKQQNISRWESNTHNPDILDCIKLAEFYGITLDELLGISDGFSIKTSATIGDPYSSEEREIINDFRELNSAGQKLVKETIKTLRATSAQSNQKRKI